MARNLFTKDELVLCTYAAIYDVADLGGCELISERTSRSSSSISMKIRNIAATLDTKGYMRQSTSSGLSGRTTGESARDTAWEIIQPLTLLSQDALLEKCQNILEANCIVTPSAKSAEQLAVEYKATMDRMDKLQKQMNALRPR
jgi:hypothetical protein